MVCVNYRANPAHASCARRGGRKIADSLSKAVAALGLTVAVERFNCLGNCEEGPNIKLVPNGPMLKRVDPQQLEALVTRICNFARDSEAE